MTDSVGYLHGHHSSVLRAHSWRTAANSAAYLLPHLRAGQRLVDVGCGPGTLTLDLAARVAPGPTVGVDLADDALAAARQQAARLGDHRTQFRRGDAYALDLPDGDADIAHAHQVLQHLSDPVAALLELARVCRPGGLLAVRDADYAAMAWYPDYPELHEWRRIYRDLALRGGGTPDAGRRLLGWALEAGLRDVTSSASVWCFATPQDRDWWGGQWAQRVRLSTFADRARECDLADAADLDEMARAWRAWAAEPAGWFLVPHGELLVRL